MTNPSLFEWILYTVTTISGGICINLINNEVKKIVEKKLDNPDQKQKRRQQRIIFIIVTAVLLLCSLYSVWFNWNKGKAAEEGIVEIKEKVDSLPNIISDTAKKKDTIIPKPPPPPVMDTVMELAYDETVRAYENKTYYLPDKARFSTVVYGSYCKFIFYYPGKYGQKFAFDDFRAAESETLVDERQPYYYEVLLNEIKTGEMHWNILVQFKKYQRVIRPSKAQP